MVILEVCLLVESTFIPLTTAFSIFVPAAHHHFRGFALWCCTFTHFHQGTFHTSLFDIESVRALNIAFEAGPGITFPKQPVTGHAPCHPGWIALNMYQMLWDLLTL
jgi:hypothetical protein